LSILVFIKQENIDKEKKVTNNNPVIDNFNIKLRYTLPGRSNPNWDDIKNPVNKIVENYEWMNVSYYHPDSQWFKEMYVTIEGIFYHPVSPAHDMTKKLYGVLCDIYNVAAPFDITGCLYDSNHATDDNNVQVYKLFKGNDQAIRGDWDTSFNPVYNPARVMSTAWVVQRDNQYVTNFVQ
jgi:hypothetical protein